MRFEGWWESLLVLNPNGISHDQPKVAAGYLGIAVRRKIIINPNGIVEYLIPGHIVSLKSQRKDEKEISLSRWDRS